MTANYKSRHGSFSWVKQPSRTGGLAAASTPSFAATDTGSTTTIVAANLGGANAAAWVGNIVECVGSENEENIGCRAMVVEFNSTTHVLTLDQVLPTATVSGDRFKMYTTPDAPVVATSAIVGGATVVATGRTESTDDYWEGVADVGGYYLEAIHGDNISAAQHPLIAGFTAASDTFAVTPSFAVNIAVGDLMRCVRHPDVEGVVMLAPERPDLPSNTLVAGYGSAPATPGNRGGGGACVLHGRGPGAGRDGFVAEIDEALSCVLQAAASTTGVLVDSGSSTTSINWDAGGSTPVVGDVYVTEEGHAFLATAVGASTITPYPPLPVAPAAGTALTAARKYTPATNLQAALTVYNWLGSGILDIFYGVVPVPTFDFARGDFAKINLQLLATDHYQTVGERSWYPRLPTSQAQRTRDMRCALYDGSTTLELPLLAGAFDPGIETMALIDLCSPNESAGYEIINVQGRGTLKVRVSSTTRRLLRDWQGKRGLGLALQDGAGPGSPGVRGVIAYDVRLGAAPVSDDGGELALDLAFTVVRNETALGLSLPQYTVFWA